MTGSRQSWVSCAHKAGTVQRLLFPHGGIKGEAEGLARKQWILEGIRHPSSYQQDLWTMVGSEVHTAHGH